jgi:hypothetical protein
LSEEILGEVLEGRRDNVLIATKARMVIGDGPNEGGASRYHLIFLDTGLKNVWRPVIAKKFGFGCFQPLKHLIIMLLTVCPGHRKVRLEPWLALKEAKAGAFAYAS